MESEIEAKARAIGGLFWGGAVHEGDRGAQNGQ